MEREMEREMERCVEPTVGDGVLLRMARGAANRLARTADGGGCQSPVPASGASLRGGAVARCLRPGGGLPRCEPVACRRGADWF